MPTRIAIDSLLSDPTWVLSSLVQRGLDCTAAGILAGFERIFPGETWERDVVQVIGARPDVPPTTREALSRRNLDVSSLLLPIQAFDRRWPSLRQVAVEVRQYRNDFVHRNRDERRERDELWRRHERIRDFLGGADAILLALESESFRKELAELAAAIEVVLAGRPLPTPAERAATLAAGAPRRPDRLAAPAAHRQLTACVLPRQAADFEFSAEQRRAVDAIVEWFRHRGDAPVFALSGPAGSGKTAIIREVLDQLGLTESEVAILAPTTKAREVLRSRLRSKYRGACRTLASFLWNWGAPIADGQDAVFPNRRPRRPDQSKRLVIVDEASMLSTAERHGLEPYRSLLVGDPAQLPPVLTEASEREGIEDAAALNAPDFELAEVKRQGPGSAIWRAAERVRAGSQLDLFAALDSSLRILDERSGDIGEAEFEQLLLDHDVIVTGRNATRIRVNALKRQLIGCCIHAADWLPKAGEWLVAEGGFKPRAGMSGVEVDNGERLEVLEVHGLVQVREDLGGAPVDEVRATLRIEGRPTPTVAEFLLSGQMLRGLHLHGGRKDTYDISGSPCGVLRAEWGYAITVHKAQGSEWARVLVIDDLRTNDEHIPRNRWLYTAITRATERLTVLRIESGSRLLER